MMETDPVPERSHEWPVKRLRFSIISNPVRSEVADRPEDDLVSFVPMEAVGEFGELDASQERQIADVYTGYTYFAEGDVVVAKITPCFENGKGAVATGLCNGVGFGTTELHVLRAEVGISNRWLYYLTVSEPFRRIGESEMLGAGGQKRVPEDFIKDFRVGVPEFEEQEQIANFLDWKTGQIDTLIAKKRALIERLKEKRLAVITQAVTKGLVPDTSLRDSCIPWLGSIPVHWKTPPLSYRYSVELGKMLDEKRITRDALVPYLRNVDVQWDSINFDDLPEMDISEAEYDRYTVASGDILVCEGGEVGRCAIVHETSSVIGFQKALHRLRPLASDEDPRFMYYSLFWAASSGIFNIESASTIAHLTAEQLRRYRLPQPSFGEQQEIARFLDQQQGKWSRLLLKAAEAIEQLLEYRSALITAVVTGKLDVPRHDIHATA